MKNLHFIKISLSLLALIGYLGIVVFGPIHMVYWKQKITASPNIMKTAMQKKYMYSMKRTHFRVIFDK